MAKTWVELKRAQRNYVLRLLNNVAMNTSKADEDEAIKAAMQVLSDATMFPVSQSK